MLAGGHTTNDDEPKFGLSVTGVVHPDRYWRNAGAKARGRADSDQADRKRRHLQRQPEGPAFPGGPGADPRRADRAQQDRGRDPGPVRRACRDRHHRLRAGRPCPGDGQGFRGDPGDRRRLGAGSAGSAGDVRGAASPPGRTPATGGRSGRPPCTRRNFPAGRGRSCSIPRPAAACSPRFPKSQAADRGRGPAGSGGGNRLHRRPRRRPVAAALPEVPVTKPQRSGRVFPHSSNSIHPHATTFMKQEDEI